jgi:probable HAF family extracellular repeat protein
VNELNRRSVLAAALATAACPEVANAAVPSCPHYRLKAFGGPGQYPFPSAINLRGEVVGYCLDPIAGNVAFIYRKGRMQRVPGLPADIESYAYAINDHGDVAGQVGGVGFVYRGGAIVTLPPPDGYAFSSLNGINNAGDVVGGIGTGDGFWRAVLLQGEALVDLGTLEPGGYSFALDINEMGQITGYASVDSVMHGFLHEKGVMRELGAAETTGAYTPAINNRGAVVGSANFHAADSHPALFRNGRAIDLGGFGGAGGAYGINDAGDIVGSSDVPSDTGPSVLPFVYTAGKMWDLNKVTWRRGMKLSVATAINNNGQITGHGGFPDEDYSRVFVLTPIPACAA